MHLERGALDYQGAEVADGSSHWLICAFCLPDLSKLLESWLSKGEKTNG